MSRRALLLASGLAALFVVAVVLATVVAVEVLDRGAGAGSVPARQQAPAAGETSRAQQAFPPDIADLVEQVRNSVVSITTTGPGAFGQTQAGQGSGFVVDRDGHILTNFHVVQGAQSITVQLQDGTLAEAEPAGADPGNDLALLRIDVDPSLLHPVAWGNSDDVRPGEPVFAIGNPFGFNFTVTAGIISATDRNDLSSPIQRRIIGALQTDAAINPGNSGGPLFNMNGEVIGINTAIENPTGARVFVGIGLAVPSNNATRGLDEMRAGRIVAHAYLGVSGVPLTPTTAREFGLDVDRGFYVLGVQPRSPAEQAGIRSADPRTGQGGDVIVEFAGQPIRNPDDLVRLVDRHDPGDTVPVVVVRNGDRTELQPTLGQWEPQSLR